MTQPAQGLPKSERLCSLSRWAAIMKGGKSSFAFPVKMWFLDAPESLLQVGFIAPKRRYRRATDRNRQKRLLREAYRRSPVRPPVDLPLTIVFMSVGPTEIDQKTVQKAMDALLLQLKNHLNDHPSD